MHGRSATVVLAGAILVGGFSFYTISKRVDAAFDDATRSYSKGSSSKEAISFETKDEVAIQEAVAQPDETEEAASTETSSGDVAEIQSEFDSFDSYDSDYESSPFDDAYADASGSDDDPFGDPFGDSEETVGGGSGLAMSLEDLDGLDDLFGDLKPLPEVQFPEGNPQTAEKVELGKMLYFDKRLSRNNSMSCATCHDPENGWADGRKRAIGFAGHELGRHSPSVLNTAFNGPQFWDGRATGLEAQAVGPIMAAGEMNMPSEEAVVERIVQAGDYDGRFETVFGETPSLPLVGKAIASFERLAVTRDSRFDQYVDGNKDVLNDQEKRGLILFMTTASCTACHKGANFTDNKFHNLGVRQEGPLSTDDGRFAVTGDDKDRGAFKTPTIRNITETGPYMHDGSLQTLKEVVEFYNDGGGKHKNKSRLIQKLGMSNEEIDDVVAFLKSLTGKVEKVQIPEGAHFGI